MPMSRKLAWLCSSRACLLSCMVGLATLALLANSSLAPLAEVSTSVWSRRDLGRAMRATAAVETFAPGPVHHSPPAAVAQQRADASESTFQSEPDQGSRVPHAAHRRADATTPPTPRTPTQDVALHARASEMQQHPSQISANAAPSGGDPARSVPAAISDVDSLGSDTGWAGSSGEDDVQMMRNAVASSHAALPPTPQQLPISLSFATLAMHITDAELAPELAPALAPAPADADAMPAGAAPAPGELAIIRYIADALESDRIEDLEEEEEEELEEESNIPTGDEQQARERFADALAARRNAADAPGSQARDRDATVNATVSSSAAAQNVTPAGAPVPEDSSAPPGGPPASDHAANSSAAAPMQRPVRAHVRVERRGAFDDLQEVHDAVIPPRRAIASILPSDAHLAAALTLAYTLRKSGNALPLILFHMAHAPPAPAVRSAVVHAGWDLRALERVEPFYKNTTQRYQDACVPSLHRAAVFS